VTGSDGVARRAPLVVPTRRLPVQELAGVAVVVGLIVVWLLAYPRTPDLAAQVYRVGLFKQIGLGVFDEHWYAGHELLGYSLLFPAFGAWLGVKLAGALCAFCSTVLFWRLAVGAYPRGARWATALFAVAAVGDVWLGRLAFAFGVSLALGACLAYARGHRVVGVLLCALCAAASPVAGLLLGLAAVSAALSQRSFRVLLLLGLPGASVVAAMALLFPEGGDEPFPLISFVMTAGVVLLFLWSLPRGDGRLLRFGAWVYLAACILFLVVHTPVGSNIERYGVLLAAPLLLAARIEHGASRRLGGLGVAGALAVGLISVWVLWGPVRETSAVAGSEATNAAYYVPLERFLDGLGSGPVRVEVPLTRSHWEAALLAPKVSLARGWDKQMDTRYDGVLLGGLTAASYERWLHEEAVSYVALPDVVLDPSSAVEGRLIRSGLPYLRLVSSSTHWRIYRVLGSEPLASGPGHLVSLGHDTFSLDATSAGRFLVRVHFSRYWTLLSGQGCVGPAGGGWTWVRTGRPGPVEVGARFSFARAFEPDGSCSSGSTSSGSSPKRPV
jgi:hypothetical protein